MVRKAQRKNRNDLLKRRNSTAPPSASIVAPRERTLSRTGGDIFKNKASENGFTVQLLPEIHLSRFKLVHSIFSHFFRHFFI
jgi:hypothetical protein